ncbi:MAG: hypothetical protein HQL22_01240 [Candidatus Omnitrophica bacterium]|nr:hypothetical protein [Candidatus Omnitrophota bacterium]
MTFQELLAEAKKIDRVEARADLAHYFEIVVAKPGLEAVEVLLRSHFGDPVKPKGHPVPAELAARTKPFGGIQPNQTMYFRQADLLGEFAFLWPWSDGLSVTVKIITT